jgi:hypothetical protein
LSQKCITYIDLIDDENLAAEIIAKRGRRPFTVKAGDTMDIAKKAGSGWGAQIRADIMAWAMDRVNNGGDDKFGAAISSLTKGFVKELQKGNGSTMLWNLDWNDHQARVFFNTIIDGFTTSLNEQDLTGIQFSKLPGDDNIRKF